MKWTRTKPTVSGEYWYRNLNKKQLPCVVTVYVLAESSVTFVSRIGCLEDKNLDDVYFRNADWSDCRVQEPKG